LWISTPHIPVDYRGPTTRTFTPFGDPAGAPAILTRLAEVCRRRGGEIAVDDGRTATSFERLHEGVARLASTLARERSVAPVAVLLPPALHYVLAVFASLAAARPALLLDATHPAPRNRSIIDAAGATQQICLEPLDGCDLGIIDPRSACLPDASGNLSSALISAVLQLDAPAFILATSGSTGQPKLIAHSQRTMLHWLRSMHDGMHLNSTDQVLSLSSCASLGGFAALLAVPLAGATLRLLDLRERGIGGLLTVLAGGSITILRAAPSLLRGLAALPEAREAFASLRIVQTYGEALLMSDVRALREVLPADCRIRSTYGSTEASGMTWYAHPSDAHDSYLAPAGALMPDTQAAILSDEGTPCEPGEAGELVIRSRYNALGEWRDGALSAGNLEPDAEDPEVRIFRSGDLARCGRDGVFVVMGRKDRMLNVNGQRVEPAEVEAAIRRAGCAEVEVLPVRQRGASAMMAFIGAGSAEPAALESRLRAQLRRDVPPYMVPARFVMLNALPRLPGGKVDLPALYELAGNAP